MKDEILLHILKMLKDKKGLLWAAVCQRRCKFKQNGQITRKIQADENDPSET